jgi:hypothetical protein
VAVSTGKAIAYTGWALPVFYIASAQNTYVPGPLSSLEWVVKGILLCWFLVGLLTVANDIIVLTQRYRPIPREEWVDTDDPPSDDEDMLYTALVSQETIRDLRVHREPPAPIVIARPEPRVERPRSEERPQPRAIGVRAPEPQFTAMPDSISIAGNNPTLERATDPSLPWPAPWDMGVLDAIREQAKDNGYVPMYLGVTRWKADGSPINGRSIAPLVRKLYPGSQLAVLVAGGTDSGKSVALNTMLLTAAYSASPEQFIFDIVELDANGVNFQAVSMLPHCQGVVTRPSDALMLAIRIGQEHKRRSQLFVTASQRAGRQLDDIGAYNAWAAEAGEAPLPIRMVVIDELRTFMEACKAHEGKHKDFATHFVESMAYAMRKTGIGPVFATQYPIKEVLPRLAMTQVEVAVCTKLRDETQTRVVFGDAQIPYRPEHLPAISLDPKDKKYTGRCVIRLGGKYYLGQTAMVPNKESLVEQIAGTYITEPELDKEASDTLMVE